MPAAPTISLIRANLTGRYFPERHGVWGAVEGALGDLCDRLGLRLHVADGIAEDARTARLALDRARAADARFVLLVHGGFTMGDVAREIAAAGLPMGVWSVPEPVRTGDVQLNNFVSLNMTLSIARTVRDLRRAPIRWYHGAPDSAELLRRLETTLRAIAALDRLAGASIGLVGGLAPTFYNMAVSEADLRARLGIEVAAHEMAELTGRMAALDPGRIAAERGRIETAAAVRDVPGAQMDLTASCALALRDLAEAGGYDALAVSDWPALQADPGMHPGAAFSWLEETDGLACASEGDVMGAATQLLARAVSGRVGCLLDMTDPDLETGRLLMWHGGGGPLYMADDAGAAWISHPMIGREVPDAPPIGTIADFTFRPGPHTIFRIARSATTFFAMQAEVAAQDPSGFDGCRGWMESFDIAGEAATLTDVVATVMAHGLEHHFVALPGRHTDMLMEFAGWAGMDPLGLVPDRPHLRREDFS